MLQTRFLAVFTDISKLIEEGRHIEREHPLSWEYLHMASTAHIGRIIALKRGYDPERAAVACLLHDLGRVVSGKQEGHAPMGGTPAREILDRHGYDADEIEEIVAAVVNHGKKAETGSPLEEIVKDADVVDCALYGILFEREGFRGRLRSLRAELDLALPAAAGPEHE